MVVVNLAKSQKIPARMWNRVHITLIRMMYYYVNYFYKTQQSVNNYIPLQHRHKLYAEFTSKITHVLPSNYLRIPNLTPTFVLFCPSCHNLFHETDQDNHAGVTYSAIPQQSLVQIRSHPRVAAKKAEQRAPELFYKIKTC